MEYLLDDARPKPADGPEVRAMQVQPLIDGTPSTARVGEMIRSRPPVKLPGREELVAELHAGQNFPAAVTAGAAAAALGAALWVAIAFVTGHHMGWMALGAGVLIGGAVRLRGQGLESHFNRLAAALAAGSCLLGKVLTICVVGTSGAFHPLNLLFCGLAICAAYQLACRPLTQREIDCIIMTECN